MESKGLNLWQKINEVKKIVRCFAKDASTSGSGSYKYISGGQILTAIKDKMEELGLLLLPTSTIHRGWTTWNYKNRYGDEKTDFIVDGELIYEWINVDNPEERQVVHFQYYGQQDDISKAFGSALTYSERYILLKSLGAPTDEDDPDKKGSTGNTTSTERKEKPGGKKTRFQIVNDLIKDSWVKMSDVLDLIKSTHGASMRMDKLSDEDFEKLLKTIERNIKMSEGGDKR